MSRFRRPEGLQVLTWLAVALGVLSWLPGSAPPGRFQYSLALGATAALVTALRAAFRRADAAEAARLQAERELAAERDARVLLAGQASDLAAETARLRKDLARPWN